MAEAITGIESVADNNNYSIIITQSHESYEKELNNLEQLLWKSVDGLLVSLTKLVMLNILKKCAGRRNSVVFFDCVPQLLKTHKVVADNGQGTYEATIQLIKGGCRRITQITSAATVSISEERLAGYEKALSEYQLPTKKEYIKYCDHRGMISDERAVNELLELDEKQEAIITASDRITIECFASLKKGIAKNSCQVSLMRF